MDSVGGLVSECEIAASWEGWAVVDEARKCVPLGGMEGSWCDG